MIVSRASCRMMFLSPACVDVCSAVKSVLSLHNSENLTTIRMAIALEESMSRETLQIEKIGLPCKLRIALFLALSAYGSQTMQGQSCQPTSCPTTDDCSYSEVGPRTNIDTCKYPDTSGCPADQQANAGCCSSLASPIIFDLNGKGFHLSSLEKGVQFRIYPNRKEQYRVAWPEEGSQNAWLVLDRNGNGTIDDFSEFFGDETPQPKPIPGKSRNGFAALAVYDTAPKGGNEDGW